MKKRLPIGIENFKRIIRDNYYYVDKTDLIKEILDNGSKVILFTRPQCFGKTLNMSMLRYYFEKPIDGKSHKQLFDELNIAKAGEQYSAHQEQYPVISLTMKSAKQPTYELAYHCIMQDISKEFARHNYVLESEKLTDEQKTRFKLIMSAKAEETEYIRAFSFLSDCLCKYHEKKVIVLLDEYDVPLENAYYAGFYDKMIAFVRSLFESVLKTNDNLFFAVITGCLRISKESIFTGLNNLNIISILDKTFGEYFGFTEAEVAAILHYYDRDKRFEDVRRWYDGYIFGNTEVYNPWSVINFVDKLVVDEDEFPTSSWANSSSNSIIRDLIYNAGSVTKRQIQDLIDGGTIEKQIHEDITYADIHTSEDNLWNFLFFTGYLKAESIRFDSPNRYAALTIPNIEVKSIYTNQIQNWFRDDIKSRDLTLMYDAMLKGDYEVFQSEITKLLRGMISYMDNKEVFYHGFMLGLLANLSNYTTRSNRESGNGRYDIAVFDYDTEKIPVLMELKLAKKPADLPAAAQRGLDQIKERRYAQDFADDGYTEALCYGISFYKKQVCVKSERIEVVWD